MKAMREMAVERATKAAMGFVEFALTGGAAYLAIEGSGVTRAAGFIVLGLVVLHGSHERSADERHRDQLATAIGIERERREHEGKLAASASGFSEMMGAVLGGASSDHDRERLG